MHNSPTSDPLSSGSIQMLPNEMLAAIFEAGARSTFQDDRGLPFIITVSHVCQHWRAVAYSFPNAWCCIPVHMKRDAMTELFLARSEGHLLQICIHFRCSFTPASAQRALTHSSNPPHRAGLATVSAHATLGASGITLDSVISRVWCGYVPSSCDVSATAGALRRPSPGLP